MIINSYDIFKESLKNDMAFDAKVKNLIAKLERLQEIQNEKKNIEEKLVQDNTELSGVLTKMKAHSIIVDGILLEMVPAYQSNRFSDKAFFEAVNEAADILGKDILETANKYKEIYSKTTEFKFLKGNANATKTRAARPHGDFTKNEGLFDGVRDFFNNIINWAKSFFVKAERNIERVKDILAGVGVFINTQPLNEDMSQVGNTPQIGSAHQQVTSMNKLIASRNLIKYIGRSVYKQKIFDVLSTQEYATINEVHANGNTSKGLTNTVAFLAELTTMGLVYRIKSGRVYKYFLSPDGITLCEENGMTISHKANPQAAQKAITQDPEINKPAYDPAAPVKIDAVTYDTTYLGEALKLAKISIDSNKQKLQLEAEEELIKEEAAKLFEELNLLDVVINDKIYKLYSQSRKYLQATEFQKAITTIENVGTEMADTFTDLIANSVNYFDVSGSLRQYSDDSKSPDGTLGAHFNHTTLKVEPPVQESVINENIFRKAFSWIKGAFRKMFKLRKNVEKQLATI